MFSILTCLLSFLVIWNSKNKVFTFSMKCTVLLQKIQGTKYLCTCNSFCYYNLQSPLLFHPIFLCKSLVTVTFTLKLSFGPSTMKNAKICIYLCGILFICTLLSFENSIKQSKHFPTWLKTQVFVRFALVSSIKASSGSLKKSYTVNTGVGQCIHFFELLRTITPKQH